MSRMMCPNMHAVRVRSCFQGHGIIRFNILIALILNNCLKQWSCGLYQNLDIGILVLVGHNNK